MNEKIKTLLTYDNIKSYSDACISLNELLIEKQNEFDLLIIPSRGAYPFYSFAQYSSYSLGSKIEACKINSHYKVWLLPYTADWGNAKIQADSLKIRIFWTKVLYDTIQRVKSPYTQFYSSLIDSLRKEITFNSINCKLNIQKRYDKFIFVDTAISGRAICNIIEAFDSLNIKDYYIILLAQNNGNDLKKKFRNIIEHKVSIGKLKVINVLEIFSEDASPLLNGGISTMVFPSLIERACDEIAEFKRNEFCGAGLWFIDSTSHLYGSNLNGVKGNIHSLLHTGLMANFKKYNFDELLKHNSDKFAEMIISKAGNFNLFDPEKTKFLIKNRIKSKNENFNNNMDVTSSHVVRTNLNDKLVKEILKQSNK